MSDSSNVWTDCPLVFTCWRREAQADLPRLIRRLTVQAGSITEIALPPGESVSRPGWDGQLVSEEGDPWVPAGPSLRELSVRLDVTGKADDDYEERTVGTESDHGI